MSTLREELAARSLVFGAAPLGNLFRAISDDQASEALATAWDAGIRHFDTAPHYGLGLSERRLGAFLSDKPRDAYTISTKVGRLIVPNEHPTDSDIANGFAVPGTSRRHSDSSDAGVRRSLEDSLDRLGLDHVDILYLHDPDESDEGLDAALDQGIPALARLRDEGVVGAVGVGTKSTEAMLRTALDGTVDLIMCSGRYTLLEQPAAAEVLPACAANDIDVVAVSVLHSGLLARQDVPDDAHYEYGPAPKDVIERARELAALCAEFGVELPTAALHYPLRNDRVIAVAVGSGTAAHVRDAVRRAAVDVPDALWDRIDAWTKGAASAH